jgi:dTMP kinase
MQRKLLIKSTRQYDNWQRNFRSILSNIKMLSGRLIALEGLDKAGKGTQARLLEKNLQKLGYHSDILSFPQYDGPLGQEILRCVQDKRAYPPTVIQLLFSAQRLTYEPTIRTWLEDGHIVIIDRYTDSGLVYGMARGLDREWLRMVEQPMPRPFLKILLDVSPKISFGRGTTERDSFESDRMLLEKVHEIYGALVTEQQTEWVVVDGSRRVEDVEATVLAVVKKRLEKA